MEIHVSANPEVPNVVRINIPSDHSTDGAAWVYVPSAHTIYVGPPGSYESGGLVDLAAAVKRVTDVKKGEKIVNGILFDDGFVDYFDKPEGASSGLLIHALQDYHQMYYEGEGIYSGHKDKGHYDENQWMNYPTEDDTVFDPEDDNWGDDDDPIYDNETGQIIGYMPRNNTPTLDSIPDDDKWSWLKDRDWSGKGDYSVMKPTPGTSKPIADWSKEDHLAWRDEADAKRGKPGYFGGWASREDLNHFRWSFGDDNLVKGAPHQGLWLWPTEGGYPDHFSQTGSEGLGNCAQGRVYPHFDNKWEILTWPERPRNVKDPHIKEAIKAEAQAAVKQYLIDKIGVDPKNIFFTEMHYGEAVSSYNSPAYPGSGYSKSKGTPGLDTNSFDWDTERGSYDYYGQDSDWHDRDDDAADAWAKRYDESLYRDPKTKSVQHGTPLFDSNGDATYVTEYDPKTQTMRGRPAQSDQAGILQRAVERIKQKINDQQPLTPEEKWELAIQEHNEAMGSGGAGMEYDKDTGRWYPISPKTKPSLQDIPDISHHTDAPEGTSRIPTGDTEYIIHKNNGKITVVDDASYERAVEEYGQEYWYLAFGEPGDQITDIEKKQSSIHDYEPDMVQGFLDSLKSQGQPHGQSYNDSKGPMKQEAFCWLGVGYGEDAGEGDPKNAEVFTDTTHWRIVNTLIGTKIRTIGEFMKLAEGGSIGIPMLWGWVTRHPMMEGVYVEFLSHLMGGVKQDLEFIPQALAAISNHYKQPIESYEVEDSDHPIMEHHPVSGKGGDASPPDVPPDPGLATAPVSLDLGQRGNGPVDPPPGARILKQDTVGFVSITTYSLGHDQYESEIMGGELDGHVFPSYSQQEAEEMHDLLVRDETNNNFTNLAHRVGKEAMTGQEFNPDWKWVFAYSPEELPHDLGNMLTTTVQYPNGLTQALADRGVNPSEVLIGRVGKLYNYFVYQPDNDQAFNAIAIQGSFNLRFGTTILNWPDTQEAIAAGEFTPIEAPTHGCFGYIDHHLIIGKKHHQEIMYRLLENGWTWEDLLNAPQVWGWFSKESYGVDYGEYSLWFSSDAGLMTDKKLETETQEALEALFKAKFVIHAGYGGKDKEEFGGNFKDKYGDPENESPEEMSGYNTKIDSTLLTPLPPPPAKPEVQEPEPEEPVKQSTLEKLIGHEIDPMLVTSKRKKKVRYHGLHHPHVLHHVFMYHNWFENCVPHVDDHDGDDNDTSSDLSPTTTPVSPE